MAALFDSAPRRTPAVRSRPDAPADTTASASPNTASGGVTGGVRMWLRAEGLATLAVAGVLYGATGRGWGYFALLFLVPDLSFVAYVAGPRVGAAAYNALHSYVGPLACVLLARSVAFGAPAAVLLPIAYIWAAHIGFDRLVGYGLKYPSAFGDTHLGRVGRASRS